jgi:MFS transporter, ACS family, hexuronate transporter
VSPDTPSRARTGGSLIRNLRWYIAGLLLFAAVINYIDRQVFSILAPELQRVIGWNELDYGRIVIAFQLAYALMLLVSGQIVDRIGTRAGFALAIIWWSIAAAMHALARNAFQFGVARFALGIGEAANFPASVKAVAEWFPAKERATATGIFNGGPTIGAIVAPILVPIIAAAWGWQAAFILTGLVGFIWVAAWWWLYHRPELHPRISSEELAYIEQGRSEKRSEKTPWLSLLKYRQTWAYAFGKILPDPVWWFFLFWLPKFLAQSFNMHGKEQMAPLAYVYVMAGIGSIIAGYSSSALLKRGWSVNKARKTTFGVIAFAMPVVIVAAYTKDAWTAVFVIGLGTGLHQAFSTMVFTSASDMFPAKAVGSVIGIGGAIAGVVSMLAAEYTGRILQASPGFYQPMFIVAGTAYIAAFIIIHLLVPRMEPVTLD